MYVHVYLSLGVAGGPVVEAIVFMIVWLLVQAPPGAFFFLQTLQASAPAHAQLERPPAVHQPLVSPRAWSSSRNACPGIVSPLSIVHMTVSLSVCLPLQEVPIS